MDNKGVINRYWEFMPVSSKTPIVTIPEGDTPMVHASNLARTIGAKLNLYLKYEGLNPTGSFKDRGMTVAISKAMEENSRAVICASTGNTSASAAAYSARCCLKCIVLIPEGAIALGKLSQAMIHGAKVLQVKGNFDVALQLVKKISEEYPVTLVNSLNPYRIEGQKSAAFEIVDYLGDAPDYQFMPVGNAGNITAYWKGYNEYREAGRATKLPRMMGFQAAKSAPIVMGYPIKNPETIATAIRIGNPASWKKAEQARDESGGVIDMVTDEEIIEAYNLLACQEGIFAEPASAASVAGLKKYVERGYFKECSTVVCILTGHGLKDPDRAIKVAQQPKIVEPEVNRIVEELGL